MINKLILFILMFTGMLPAYSQEADKNSDYNFSLTYKSDFVNRFSKGSDKKAGFLGNLDLTFDMNLKKITGSDNLSLFLYGLGAHGDDPTDFLGDSFTVSNIEAPDTFKVYEAYFQYTTDYDLTAKLGLRDLNAEFYSTETSKLFINSAFGISPSLSKSVTGGPSIFPVTSLSFNLNYTHDFYSIGYGIFNATAGDSANPYGTHVTTSEAKGYLNILELGLEQDKIDLPFKYKVGVWSYTKEINAIDTTKSSEKNSGTYLLADQRINSILSVFAKYGLANSKLNQFSSNAELGLAFQGLFNSRPNDQLLFGTAHGVASADYERINSSASSENVLELGYHCELHPHFSVTPDLQYITNPGLSLTNPPVFVGILRLEMGF